MSDIPDFVDQPGNRMRWLMDQRCVAAPGAFCGLVARAVREAGFEACYVSGGATSAAAGVPDVGLLSVDRFCQIVREVADGCGLPVIADADTGFGEEEMTRRTVIAYSRAGAAGLHIEDQVFPKRCGHLDGKELLPLEDAASKVRWAAEAANELGNGMLVCARTDARGVTGMEEAITRAEAYVAAGADMIFPEGLRTEGEFAIFAEKLNALGDQRPYLLANMTEFGKTPIIPLERFEQMGYSLVIYPVTTLRITMAAVTEALDELMSSGSAEDLLPRMQTREQLYRMLGYTPGEPWRSPSGGAGVAR